MRCQGVPLAYFLVFLQANTLYAQHLSDGACKRYPAYTELLRLNTNDLCVSIGNVFKLLDAVSNHSTICRHNIVNLLADHFGEDASTPQHCNCTGKNNLYVPDARDGITNHYRCQNDPDYKSIYRDFYFDGTNYVPSECQTHHSLWYRLSRVHQSDSLDCQGELIHHLKYTEEQHASDCTCDVKDCTSLDGYNAFLERRKDKCISSNTIWHHIYNIEIYSERCRHILEQYLNSYYLDSNNTAYVSEECECHQTEAQGDERIPILFNGLRDECSDVPDSSYAVLRSNLFEHVTEIGCTTQNYLWTQLANIKPYKGQDCVDDFIKRAVIRYPDRESDPCSCMPKVTTTTSTASTTTTTVPPVTITHLSLDYECNKTKVIGDIAFGDHVDNSEAYECGVLNRGSNEAYVLDTCDVPHPSNWTRGLKVMKNCDKIPAYTPIATFIDDKYDHIGAESGILLTCLEDGFIMGVQYCGKAPEIVHIVTGGSFNNDPEEYYVIS